VPSNPRGWRPVKPGVERVVPVEGAAGPTPLFELQMDLEDGPTDGEWAHLFMTSPIMKAGDHSMMETEPTLVGSIVTWTVSQSSLPHAEKFIRRRIEWANEHFSAELPQELPQELAEELSQEHGASAPSPPAPPEERRETEAIQWFLESHRQKV
jgi:hypothetical protein